MRGGHDGHSARAPWWKGARGEWYVVMQFIIFGFIAVGPRSAPGLPVWAKPYTLVANVAGVALMVAGAALALWGVRALGTNTDHTAVPQGRLDARHVRPLPTRPQPHLRRTHPRLVRAGPGGSLVVEPSLRAGVAGPLRPQVPPRRTLAARTLPRVHRLPAAGEEAAALGVVKNARELVTAQPPA